MMASRRDKGLLRHSRHY